MQHIKTHKINPVYTLPGDTIKLHYAYQETTDGPYKSQILTMDTVESPMIIDTVVVYRIENEYGLKAGRALMMGTDDGTYKDIPLSVGKIPR